MYIINYTYLEKLKCLIVWNGVYNDDNHIFLESVLFKYLMKICFIINLMVLI